MHIIKHVASRESYVRACDQLCIVTRSKGDVCPCVPYIATHKYMPSHRSSLHPCEPLSPRASHALCSPRFHSHIPFSWAVSLLSLSRSQPCSTLSPFLAPHSTVIYVSACARRTGQRVSVPLVCLLYYRGSNENLCRHKRSCQQHAA